MKNVRVWFNHWFSTAYHIIRLLKDDERINFVVTGSNTDDRCVYRAVCDEWETEPDFCGSGADAYVDFCLDFCAKHKIDVFIPRRSMHSVSRRLAEFSAVGVKVLAEHDYPLVNALRDKVKTYEMFTGFGIGHVPPYRAVTSAAEYEAAYHQLKTGDNRVCLKFSVDEGAVSFRVVDDCVEDSLTDRVGAKITYESSVKALSKLGEFPTLLVMPYLPGPEVSADCLYMPDGGHIIIPRFKLGRRSEEIRFEKEITDVCDLFLNKFKPQCPCNLQFKYDKNIKYGKSTPYLLEVNTRMSGGIQLSCAASGINIPNIAVNRLLGIEKNFDKKGCRSSHIVTFIETPVVLGQG